MGNARSMEVNEEDVWWTNGESSRQEQQTQSTAPESIETLNVRIDQKTLDCEITESSDRAQRKREMEEDLMKFKQELAKKHDRRRQLIREKRKEMTDLREELIREKEENEKLRRLLQEKHSPEISAGNTLRDTYAVDASIHVIREENEDLRNEVEKLKLTLKEREILADKNKELRISLAELQKELQNVNTQIISFEKERIDYQEHVTALKDIVRVTKEMLRVRESQIEELKKKISSIEELLASKEISILSDDLRKEYERQLRNIRDLRILYEDRQRVDRREKENLKSQIEDLKKSLEDEQKKNGELSERVDELEEDVSKKYDKVVNLESTLGLAQAECKELHAERDVINQLFSQILISFNNDQDIDLENMIKILEENHDLLTNIVVNDESNQTFAMPKVLLDLVKQVNESKKDNKEIFNQEDETLPQLEKAEKLDTIKEEEEINLIATHQLNSPEEIVENLPKVWRVLIELLSHQCPPNNDITEKKGENDNHCFKSVETPAGMSKVLSVSKTFIRLKSLILEKKSLEKEMTRLKQLNTHLEGRLSDQEKRLVLVSNELSKTWNFVGKMQKQHQQLHTQEKILRYELAQKRKLLTELKEELEHCRQKWSQARKQNSTTEEQWKLLRTEFASRKGTTVIDNNNSVESGYSDDKSSSSDEEDFDKHPRVTPEVSSQELNSLTANSDLKEGTSVEKHDLEGEFDIVERSLKGSEEDHTQTSIESDTTEKESLNTRAMLPTDSTTSEHTCSSHEENVKETGENGEYSDKCELSIVTQTEDKINEVPEVPETRLNASTNTNVISTTSSIHSENTKDCIGETNDNLLNQSTSTSGQNEEVPSTSNKNPLEAATEFAARREEKMQRLEEQCNNLYFNVAKNSLRGLVMSDKLDNLHEIYGQQPHINADDGQQPSGAEEPQREEPTQDTDSADQTNQE